MQRCGLTPNQSLASKGPRQIIPKCIDASRNQQQRLGGNGPAEVHEFKGVSGMRLARGKWRVGIVPRLVKVSPRAGHPATSVSMYFHSAVRSTGGGKGGS